MMTENTGVAMMDSGGKNGRAWQQNQGRDFSKEPDATLCWRWGLDYTINTAGFMEQNLMFAPEIQAIYEAFARWHDARERGTYDLQNMAAFFDEKEWPAFYRDAYATPDRDKFYGGFGHRHREYLTPAEIRLEIGATEEMREPIRNFIRGNGWAGIYGDGEPLTENTYNSESFLSQVLQYSYGTCEEFGDVFLVQVHGGADVRGGYTSPRAFEPRGGSELGIIGEDSRGTITAGREGTWQSDNGYSFQFESGWDREAENWEDPTGKALNDYETHDLDDMTPEELPEGWPAEILTGMTPEQRKSHPQNVVDWIRKHWAEPAVIIIDGTGYCPITGQALEAALY